MAECASCTSIGSGSLVILKYLSCYEPLSELIINKTQIAYMKDIDGDFLMSRCYPLLKILMNILWALAHLLSLLPMMAITVFIGLHTCMTGLRKTDRNRASR